MRHQSIYTFCRKNQVITIRHISEVTNCSFCTSVSPENQEPEDAQQYHQDKNQSPLPAELVKQNLGQTLWEHETYWKRTEHLPSGPKC